MCGAACRAALGARATPRPRRLLSSNAVPVGQQFLICGSRNLSRSAFATDFFFSAAAGPHQTGVVEGGDA
jgi:hypothetical protein